MARWRVQPMLLVVFLCAGRSSAIKRLGRSSTGLFYPIAVPSEWAHQADKQRIDFSPHGAVVEIPAEN